MKRLSPSVLRRFCALLSLLMICGLLHLSLSSAATAAPSTATSTMDEIQKRGVLRVGFSSFVPWAMQNKKGEFIGFEVDVASRLAKDLGVELELVPTRWAGIIPALLTGKFDIIIGSMGITPERSLKVNFSIPYDYSGVEVVLNRKTAGEGRTIASLNNPESIVAVRTGTTAATAAKRLVPNASFRMFDDEAPAVQEVLSGRAHAFFSSAPLPAFEALANPELLYLAPEGKVARQPVALAIRKGDVDTLNVLNGWITALEAEGWLEDRRAYWFQSKDWEKDMQ